MKKLILFLFFSICFGQKQCIVCKCSEGLVKVECNTGRLKKRCRALTQEEADKFCKNYCECKAKIHEDTSIIAN